MRVVIDQLSAGLDSYTILDQILILQSKAPFETNSILSLLYIFFLQNLDIYLVLFSFV